MCQRSVQKRKVKPTRPKGVQPRCEQGGVKTRGVTELWLCDHPACQTFLCVCVAMSEEEERSSGEQADRTRETQAMGCKSPSGSARPSVPTTPTVQP